MPSGMNHLRRSLDMLAELPEQPKYLTTTALSARLGVSLRTVQRDLAMLASMLPIAVNNKCRPYGYAWKRGERRVLPAGGSDA